MSKHIKNFRTHSDYQTFRNGNLYLVPNISYCNLENEVHYNPDIMNSKIIFEDPLVELILLEKYDSSEKGYLTRNDLALVTNVANLMKDLTLITKFNEFLYFTGLTTSTSSGISYILLEYTFSGCTNLLEVTLPILLNYGTGFGWPKDHNAFNNCRNLTSIGNITLVPFSLDLIKNLYHGCTSLTFSNDLIPYNITELPIGLFHRTYNSSFGETTGFRLIVIREGITKAEGNMINASNTEYVVFPTTLTSINLNNFSRDNLNRSGIHIYFKSPTVVQLVSTNTEWNRKLIFYVPDNLVSSYLNDSNWSLIINDNNMILKSDNELPANMLQYKDE